MCYQGVQKIAQSGHTAWLYLVPKLETFAAVSFIFK